jgi:thymidylate kinase
LDVGEEMVCAREPGDGPLAVEVRELVLELLDRKSFGSYDAFLLTALDGARLSNGETDFSLGTSGFIVASVPSVTYRGGSHGK